MKHTYQNVRPSWFLVPSLIVSVFLSVFSTQVVAEPVSPALKETVNEYQKKLAEWAKDPILVNAIKKANSSSTPKLDNAIWKGISKSDPVALSYQTSSAGRLLTKLQKDKRIGKLFLRDKSGNLVAGSKKPAVFNIADRPPYINAMRGKQWAANKSKSDPTTKLQSVQAATPIMLNGEVIGVLHTSVIAQ